MSKSVQKKQTTSTNAVEKRVDSTEIFKRELNEIRTRLEGFIERIEINHPLKIKHLLSIPMLIGHPQIKKEGIYEKMGFLDNQLNELNYLFVDMKSLSGLFYSFISKYH